MNLFFYLQTFILNYSFIVILSDHIFLLCFIKTQPFVKRKPVKTGKKVPKRSRSVLGRFYFLLILYSNHNMADARTCVAGGTLTILQDLEMACRTVEHSGET